MKVTAQDIIQNAIEDNPDLIQPAGFAVYDPATGAIRSAGTMGRAHILDKQAAGEPYAITDAIPAEHFSAFMDEHYVDVATKSVAKKLPFPGRITGTTLTGLPVPCRIGVQAPFLAGSGWWAPVWFDGDVADIELAFEVPDTYRVTVESTRYLSSTFLVTFSG